MIRSLKSKLFFASMVSGSTLFGSLAIGSVAHAVPTVNCTIPNNVVCNISSTKGIASVRYQMNNPFGPGLLDLVNETYSNCPKNVSVHWDSAYHSVSSTIRECGTKFKAASDELAQ
jgi:hypothetical protein